MKSFKILSLTLIIFILTVNACSSAQVSFAGSATPDVDLVKEEQEVVGLDVDIDYPSFDIEKIDAKIALYIDQIETETAPRLFEAYREAASYNSEQQPYALKVGYEIIQADNNGIDFIITQQVSTGGAQDQITIKTFMFDPKSGDEIMPLDAVDTNHDIALEKLSALCRASLQNQLLDDNANETITNMIQAATLPAEDNYQNIIRTKNGYIIYFNPDTVAPASYGIQKVVITNSDLEL